VRPQTGCRSRQNSAFDGGNQRAFYLAVLILSFVFMIGPSFHSIMSAIVGFLHAPPIY